MDEKQMGNTGYPSIDKPWMKYYTIRYADRSIRVYIVIEYL